MSCAIILAHPWHVTLQAGATQEEKDYPENVTSAVRTQACPGGKGEAMWTTNFFIGTRIVFEDQGWFFKIRWHAHQGTCIHVCADNDY